MSLRNDHSDDRTASVHRITVRDIRQIEVSDLLLRRYPVILDLENHCSAAQQREMAKALIKTFGGKEVSRVCLFDLGVFLGLDRLIIEPISTANDSKLPSPEELKHKVLLRVNDPFDFLRSENERCFFRV